MLAEAVVDGVALLTWEHETFAYADGLDDGTGRFRGLHCGQLMALDGRRSRNAGAGRTSLAGS